MQNISDVVEVHWHFINRRGVFTLRRIYMGLNPQGYQKSIDGMLNMCKLFAKTGECEDLNCDKAHVWNSAIPPDVQDAIADEKANTKRQREIQKVKRKLIPCRRFIISGTCRFGQTCGYGHIEEEVEPPELLDSCSE